MSHRQWALVEPLLRQLATWCATSVERVYLTVNVPEEVHPDLALPFAVEVICNRAAQGFGANHNQAFARCETPWFLVLNPDIRLDRDLLTEMLADAHADAGLLTPRIREPGSNQPEPFRSPLTPLELWRRRRSNHRPPPAPAWVAGMFMLLRSEAYKDVAGFDERFFMYCEDFDLCVRLQLRGWRLQVFQNLCVLHEAQRQSHTSLRALGWHLESLLKVWTSAAFWRYLLASPPRTSLTSAPPRDS